MTFVHLGLLASFLPLAITPIVLHLLTLHRLRTVELSTYRFLFDSHVRQRRRMQFEDVVLAILRTMFMLVLVLALARPIASRWGALFGGTQAGRDVVLLMDASASMDMATDGISSMQRAKDAARSIVEHLPKEDRVTVLRVAARPTEVCSRFSANSDAIQERVELLDAGASRANWLAALSHLFENNLTHLANPRLYVISDMQASGWRELPGDGSQQLVPQKTEMLVLNVGSASARQNRCIAGGAPQNHRVLPALPVILRPRVTNFSTASAELPITLFVDDEEVHTQVMSLRAGESRVAEFVYTPERTGLLQARYEIPGDAFVSDDAYRFVLTVVPDVSVLLVNGHPSSQPLEDASLFVRHALQVAQEPGSSTVLASSERELAKTLNVIEIPQPRLDANQLDEVDVVVLADCGRLSNRQAEALRDYVASGGGLVLLPGAHVDPANYNRQFFQLASDEQPLGQVRYEAPAGGSGQRNAGVKLGGVDFGHSIFSVFNDPDAQHLAGTRIFRRFSISRDEHVRDTWPLVRLADRSPLLVESRCGEGRVLLSAIPFDTTWSNLPLQPEFVPVVLRMVGHVLRQPEAMTQPLVISEAPAEIRVHKSWGTVTGSVSSGQREAAPLQFNATDDRLVASFESTERSGFYDVQVHGGPSWEPRSETLAFAVNTAPEESDFVPLDHAQLKAIFPDAQLQTIDASAEAQQQHGAIGSNRELWRTLVLLSLLVIAAEFVLATAGSHSSAVRSSAFRMSQPGRSITPEGPLSRWQRRLTLRSAQSTPEEQHHGN